MLVLTRKPGEQIVIGDNIKVSVVSIGPGRVKIGIEAPPWVEVNRQEIFEKKQSERESVDLASPSDPDVPVSEPVSETLTGAVHNRIADKLPEPEVIVVETPPQTAPRPKASRLPRKPR